MIQTRVLIQRLRNLVGDKNHDLPTPLLIDLLQQAETRVWQLASTRLDSRLTTVQTEIIGTDTTYSDSGLYTPPTDPLNIIELRIKYSGSWSDEPSLEVSLSDQLLLGTTAKPRHRVEAGAASGDSPRLRIYPVPANADSLGWQIKRAFRALDLVENLAGAMAVNGSGEGTFTPASGDWTWTTDSLKNALIGNILVSGHRIECQAIGNTTTVLRFSLAGRSVNGATPSPDGTQNPIIDVPTELPDDLANTLPGAAADLHTNGDLDSTTLATIENALRRFQPVARSIEPPQFDNFLQVLPTAPRDSYEEIS